MYSLLALLIIRTLMSIWLADVNGRVVKAIVNKSLSQFLQRVSEITDLIRVMKFLAQHTAAVSTAMTTNLCVLSIDFHPLPIRCAILNDQLRHRLHPKETGPLIQKKDDKPFP